MELHLFIDMPFCVLVPLCNLTYLKLVFHTARSTLLNVIKRIILKHIGNEFLILLMHL